MKKNLKILLIVLGVILVASLGYFIYNFLSTPEGDIKFDSYDENISLDDEIDLFEEIFFDGIKIVTYPEGKECQFDSECGIGMICYDGICTRLISKFNGSSTMNNPKRVINVSFYLMNYLDTTEGKLTPTLFQEYYVPRFEQYWELISNGHLELNVDVQGWYTIPLNSCELGSDEKPLGKPDVYKYTENIPLEPNPDRISIVIYRFNEPTDECYPPGSGGGHDNVIITFSEDIMNMEKSIYAWDNFDRLLSHEFAHVFGIFHSGALLEYEDGTKEYVEYGGIVADFMGSQDNRELYNQGPSVVIWNMPSNLNSAHLYSVGWLTEEELIRVEKSGVYNIGALMNDEGKPRAALVIADNQMFFLEWRLYDGFDMFTDDAMKQNNSGLFMQAYRYKELLDAPPRGFDEIDWINQGARNEQLLNKIALIDMFYNPADGDTNSLFVTLNKGKSYTTYDNEFTLEVIDKDESTLTFSIVFN